jgi:hypothetical protein
MRECVKCGRYLSPDLNACPFCTWPLSIDAWLTTERFRIKRITVDTNCVNSKQKDEYLNTLERWENEGRLTLQRSNVFLEELKGPEQRTTKGQSIQAHPGLFTLDISVLDGGDVLAGPDLEEPLQQILFPTTKNRNKNQNYDVEHLRQHIRTGGDVFLTMNTSDFIKHGKQAMLSRLGIWVFTPQELVELLRRLYGYN